MSPANRNTFMPFVRPALSTVFICLLAMLYNPTKAQNSRFFDIEVAKVKVGNLIVEQVKKDSLTIYIFRSEVDAWLLVKIKISHLITCIYKNNKLVRADIHSVINNKNYVSWTVWKTDHYEYDCNTYKYHLAGSTNESIDFSVVRMYFEEPLNKQKLYAENYGVFSKVQILPGSVYHVDVDKNSNTFHYLNGNLDKIEMETPLFNYIIRRRK